MAERLGSNVEATSSGGVTDVPVKIMGGFMAPHMAVEKSFEGTDMDQFMPTEKINLDHAAQNMLLKIMTQQHDRTS